MFNTFFVLVVATAAVAHGLSMMPIPRSTPLSTDDEATTYEATGNLEPTPPPYIPYDQLMNYSMYVDISNISSVMKLYTPKNPNVPEFITFDDFNKIDNEFTPNQQYKFLFHGWQYNVTSSWYEGVVAEYMKRGNINVITVEYPDVSSLADYATGKFMKQTAKHVAKIILSLHENHHVPLVNIHLIGHSGGVNVASAASRIFEMMTGNKLERITGLEPTYLTNVFWAWSLSFNANSAKFIDVIHTSFLAQMYPQGTIDFFVNGGYNQTGCQESVHCEHMVATRLFELSINDRDFTARKCDNYFEFENGGCNEYITAKMGENIEAENRKGAYFIDVDENLYDDLPKDVEVTEFNRELYSSMPYQYFD